MRKIIANVTEVEYIRMRNCFVQIERNDANMPVEIERDVEIQYPDEIEYTPENVPDNTEMPNQIEFRRQSIRLDHAYSSPSPAISIDDEQPLRIQDTKRRASEPSRKPFYVRGRRPTK